MEQTSTDFLDWVEMDRLPLLCAALWASLDDCAMGDRGMRAFHWTAVRLVKARNGVGLVKTRVWREGGVRAE